jgi:hypothetical protein
MIGPTYLEDQNLGRHRELKDGDTLMETIARSHISTIDAQRVSVMVNSIPSAVILCTRDRGSVVGSIEMRGRERERESSIADRCYGGGGEIRRGDDEEEA